MVHLEYFSESEEVWRTGVLELGAFPFSVYTWDAVGGCMQASLTVDNFLEAEVAWG